MAGEHGVGRDGRGGGGGGGGGQEERPAVGTAEDVRAQQRTAGDERAGDERALAHA
ncbi:hypothetical protein ABZS86_14070 [Streptomyces sp. NPDC005355]|uniref:hypothetical protein n=1 Tax=Streptomyces sp. NPDC005355 TaxID=3157038 RepID=UPI0033A6B300